MKLILVRHWQTENNLKWLSTWQLDIGLTDLWIQQAQEAGKKLLEENINIDKIYSSTLQRALKTAEIIKSIILANGWDINTSDLMQERDLGLQTNQPRQNRVNISSLPKDEKEKAMQDLDVEPDENIDKRIKEFITSISDKDYDNVLLVWHRWRFRRLLINVLNIEVSEDDLKNWSITIIDTI